MISITDTGLEKNSLEENLEYVYTVIRGEKGPDVDLSPTGPWGQIAAILAKAISDIDDQQEDIYLSRDPDNATGVSQDKLSAETGTIRKQATYTTVLGVLLQGDEGTVIEAGKQVGLAAEYEPAPNLYFTLDDTITISKNFTRKAVLSLDDPTTGTVYTLNINSVDYTYTAIVTDTLSTVITELIAILPSGVTGTNVDDTLSLLSSDDFILIFTPTFTLEELWNAGDFTATLTGPNDVPAGSLTEIITSVSGWSAVNNISAGITGLSKETDAELIIRRKNELVKGKSTDITIRSAVGGTEDVTASSVVSNRLDTTSGDGLPPHSFEVTVTGGDPDDIAQAILDNMPSGIQPYGVGYSGNAIDEEGVTHVIPFSRPTTTYIWVRYTRTQHPEETYPDDGDASVKANLLAWAEDNVNIGIDIIRQKLETPFFEVPGSSAVVTEFAETALPTDTPSYTTDALISVSSSEKADFDSDRIFIISP